jgi:hypothetical protein
VRCSFGFSPGTNLQRMVFSVAHFLYGKYAAFTVFISGHSTRMRTCPPPPSARRSHRGESGKRRIRDVEGWAHLWPRVQPRGVTARQQQVLCIKVVRPFTWSGQYRRPHLTFARKRNVLSPDDTYCVQAELFRQLAITCPGSKDVRPPGETESIDQVEWLDNRDSAKRSITIPFETWSVFVVLADGSGSRRLPSECASPVKSVVRE